MIVIGIIKKGDFSVVAHPNSHKHAKSGCIAGRFVDLGVENKSRCDLEPGEQRVGDTCRSGSWLYQFSLLCEESERSKTDWFVLRDGIANDIIYTRA
jgi:hypothetical protein